MRIEKTDMEFVEFDARDIIVTSSGGTVGSVGYYWISESGVNRFNDLGDGLYVLTEPWNAKKQKPLPYTYAQYNVGKQTLVEDPDGDFTQWSYGSYEIGELSTTERQYLIPDSDIESRFDEVLAWLKGTSVRQ